MTGGPTPIHVPHLGPNDDTAVVIEVVATHHQTVEADEVLMTVETSKTVVDVLAPREGFVNWQISPGASVASGQIVGLIAPLPLTPDEFERAVDAGGDFKHQPKFTKKAQLLARKHGLDFNEIQGAAGLDDGPITESDVLKLLSNKVPLSGGFPGPVSRIAILGGASGGGALLLIDTLLDDHSQLPVAVLDSNTSMHGSRILGVPVLGGFHLLDDLLKTEVDAVVIAFNRDLSERASLFMELSDKGVPFANVISTETQLRRGVKLGVGNVILGRSRVGAGSVIGDNNFISSGVHLEHENSLGSHCAFGPSVWTSGHVHIGSRVRLRTGIHVEPNVRIGDDAVIPSGSIVLRNVEAGQTWRNGGQR